MRKKAAFPLSVSLLCGVLCTTAGGRSNSEGGWQLHFAGEHNERTNTCALQVADCEAPPRGDVVVDAPGEPGRYDVYILALNVDQIAGTRYGLCCEGSFYFYGWTACCDLELPSSGWPGSGSGNAQTWGQQRVGPHVTLGILDVYTYGAGRMCVCSDPRVDFAEFCDGSFPVPQCNTTTDSDAFGCVGFGKPGYSSCGWKSGGKGERTTWGRLKATFRE